MMEEFGSTSNYLLSWEELPAVPVYMEQLLQLVNETIQPLGLPAVTKTMINSYVKQHFFSRPVGLSKVDATGDSPRRPK
ncbi:DUF1836 domain-containing protein [Lactiplantibacillus plantarum]|uniref:DUF1836 domain-containing protein n=1 Tax=Lactiplantibacillus plantarum TaxID=1590 RepID=UPI003BFA7115